VLAPSPSAGPFLAASAAPHGRVLGGRLRQSHQPPVGAGHQGANTAVKMAVFAPIPRAGL
jgi:hypothetical protein